MRSIPILVLALYFLGCSASPQPKVVEVTDSVYKPGEVWSYRTRPGEDSSTLTILRIDNAAPFGTIVHIAVEGLAIRNPQAPDGVIQRASHLPFAKAAIDSSVVRRIREAGPVPHFSEGYDEWRRAFDSGKGGIFTIPVGEAVALLEPRSKS